MQDVPSLQGNVAGVPLRDLAKACRRLAIYNPKWAMFQPMTTFFGAMSVELGLNIPEAHFRQQATDLNDVTHVPVPARLISTTVSAIPALVLRGSLANQWMQMIV